MFSLPQSGKQPQERGGTFRCHYHNNTQWIAQVQYTSWEFFEYHGLKCQGRSPASVYLNRHFPNLWLLFHNHSFSPAFLQGRFLWMFTGEMAAATSHCCSCAPGCCSCSRVSWQISGCSKSCRAAALGQAGGVLLEFLIGIAILAVFEGSEETVFYAVQEVFNVKSLVNTLPSYIPCRNGKCME